MTTVVSAGALDHDVAASARADRAVFDREGYAVARQVFEPQILRELRAPLIAGLIADGSIEPDPDDDDRFRWIGDPASFERRQTDLITDSVEQLLLRSGVAGKAIEAAWGRKPALRALNLILMPPGDPVAVHRDGWHESDGGPPEEHFNCWVPLTPLDHGDGGLAIAVGSHRIPDQPATGPMKHPMHLDVLATTGNPPPSEVLEPLWRTTPFELGDALIFRPDIVHSTTANDGPYLRIALILIGRNNNLPYGAEPILPLDASRDLAEIEWLVLAIHAVQPTTPWSARLAFASRGIVGRLWACQPRVLLERAFETLDARELVEPYGAHDPDQHEVHRRFHATSRGNTAVAKWLTTPTGRDEDLLAIKLVLCQWLDLDPSALLSEPRGSSVYRLL